MKPGPPPSRITTIVIFVLVILNGCLIKQNYSYRSDNRKLILQNDSLMAVTIKLNKEIDKQKADSVMQHNRRASSRLQRKG